MNTHWRLQRHVKEELERVLFRPWPLTQKGSYRGNSYGYFDKTQENIQKWSLTGVSEFQSFSTYQSQLSKTVKSVSDFYERQFGWSKEESKAIGEEALTSSVSRGFSFSSMFDPQFSEGEEALRKKILERASLSDISSIEFNSDDIDSKTNRWSGGPASQESILNIAVSYPEALEYLLKEGLDANKKMLLEKHH